MNAAVEIWEMFATIAMFEEEKPTPGTRKLRIKDPNAKPRKKMDNKQVALSGVRHLVAFRVIKFKNFKAALQLLKTDPSGKALGMELGGMLEDSGTRSMRIHDLGDFFSPGYARAWAIAVQMNPKIDFWAYTRSYVVAPILKELVTLAQLPNMSLWLSADNHNYKQALSAYDKNGGDKTFAGLSFVQTDENSKKIAHEIQQHVGKEHFINFQVHGNGGHVYSSVDMDLVNCPGIMRDSIKKEVGKENTKIKNAEKKGKPYSPNRDLATDDAVMADIDKFLNPRGLASPPPKCLACRGCISSNPRAEGNDLLSLQGKHAKAKNEVHMCQCSKAIQRLSLQHHQDMLDKQKANGAETAEEVIA